MTPQRALLIGAILFSSACFAAFAVYMAGLDREIRGRFAGARWALPAQVYASPLEIYPGLALGQAQFQHELERLGYRPGSSLDKPGSFIARDGALEVHTRAFRFWDGEQDAMRLRLGFFDRGVQSVTNLDGGKPQTLARLDPLLVGSIYPAHGEDRVLVRLADVPPLLPAGLVLIEDRKFPRHHGIDFFAIVRAAIANMRAGEVVQGGSTITQQLVKNFFLTNERSWVRKINEAFMAILLELHYSKEEILEAYLNEVYLGQDGPRAIHGFGLASSFYFQKPLAELQAHEVALLVALVKGPNYLNPRRHADRARERRDYVLAKFEEAEILSGDELKSALAQPVALARDSREGSNTYPAFIELVKRQLKGQYREEDLTHEGLRIFSTLDPRAQEILELAILNGLPPLEAEKKFKPGTLESSGIVTSTEGGEVQALVGGRDVHYVGFNRALDAKRPIGSLAKPFVYLAAFMRPHRYSVMSVLDDSPVSVRRPEGSIWSPVNYDKESHGAMPAFQALAHSYNQATVRLGLDVGVQNVLDAMRATGYTGPAQAFPSLMLGAIDMAPLEVAQMFNTLAAGGYYTPLMSIREVLTQDGQPLQRYPLSVQQALPEAPVYLLNWTLEQVFRIGTARGAYNVIAPEVRLAGKTGTTDEMRDSWFAGFGGDRVAVVWIGRDDNEPTEFTGASGALTIWTKVMHELDVRSFEPARPGGVGEVVANCVGATTVPYIAGYQPQTWNCGRDTDYGSSYPQERPQDDDRGIIDWFRDWFRGDRPRQRNEEPGYTDPDPRFQERRYEEPRVEERRYENPAQEPPPEYERPRYGTPSGVGPRGDTPRSEQPRDQYEFPRPSQEPVYDEPRYEDRRYEDPPYQPPAQPATPPPQPVAPAPPPGGAPQEYPDYEAPEERTRYGDPRYDAPQTPAPAPAPAQPPAESETPAYQQESEEEPETNFR